MRPFGHVMLQQMQPQNNRNEDIKEEGREEIL